MRVIFALGRAPEADFASAAEAAQVWRKVLRFISYVMLLHTRHTGADRIISTRCPTIFLSNSAKSISIFSTSCSEAV